jgi:flagellar biosynthesis protein
MKQKQRKQGKLLSREQAVALRYNPEEHESPVLTAKGKGLVARNIIEKAKEHNIPIQEDASLVEVLSKLDLDQQIPPELYELVAEVLSFVYRSDLKAEERLRGL